MSDTDLELLARYTREHAEDAFAELVRRHLGLVYSAALRQVRSPQLAEEVAQSVFIDLARSAAKLKPDTVLTAWLYQVTRRTAIDVVRREASRQLREQIATEMNAMNATAADWTHIEPLLDEAMHALDNTDRAAVLLRYFENKSLREVGATLGTSENAAQKRLARAVERLREFFAKRGVTVGASGLVVVISANAVQAAPVGLSAVIPAAILAEKSTVTAVTATAGKSIAITVVQKALVGLALFAILGTVIYRAYRTNQARRAIHALNAAAPPPPVAYLNDRVTEGPWSIHIFKVDRSRSDLHLITTMGGGNGLGVSVVSEQVKSVPAAFGRPIAAINGDFFRSSSKYSGDPQGVQIVYGELVSAPAANFSCFWIDRSGKPCLTNVQPQFNAQLPDGRPVPFGLNEARADDALVLYTSANGASTRTSGGVELVLGRNDPNGPWLPLRVGETYQARVQQIRNDGDALLNSDTMVLSAGPKTASRISGVKPGDIMTISTASWPDMRGTTMAIGGGPALVRGRTALTFRGAQPRHPRTAIGWNNEYFFLVEVDGRQQTSVGMSFTELAAYMALLGCDEALNLDGGGSATLWCDGQVLNAPSEGRERPTVNALVVVQTSDIGIQR